jgi:hypothetical protein
MLLLSPPPGFSGNVSDIQPYTQVEAQAAFSENSLKPVEALFQDW